MISKEHNGQIIIENDNSQIKLMNIGAIYLASNVDDII